MVDAKRIVEGHLVPFLQVLLFAALEFSHAVYTLKVPTRNPCGRNIGLAEHTMPIKRLWTSNFYRALRLEDAGLSLQLFELRRDFEFPLVHAARFAVEVRRLER
jgi:hypothetical protein